MRKLLVLACTLAFVASIGASVSAQLGRMELITALELGLVRAEFRGNGDTSVIGRLWAAPNGPQEVTIEPGTQFWAQLGGLGNQPFGGGLGNNPLGGGGGFGQLGGGRRQGMGALGQNPVNLGGDRFADVRIPTACTNIGLPAPTRQDIMVAVRCPDPRVARIAALYGQPDVHPAAVQIAIWAVADDPPAKPIDQYLRMTAKQAKRADPDSTVTAEALLRQASDLLRKADVDPGLFSLFQRAAVELVP
jgi:hypothetical protein